MQQYDLVEKKIFNIWNPWTFVWSQLVSVGLQDWIFARRQEVDPVLAVQQGLAAFHQAAAANQSEGQVGKCFDLADPFRPRLSLTNLLYTDATHISNQFFSNAYFHFF